MKPLIYAKSAWLDWQAATKQALGCDALEIQLFSEIIIDRSHSLYRPYRDVFNVSNFVNEYRIDIVHSPLIKDSGDTLLEAVIDSKDLPLLIQLFDMAQEIATIQQHKVGIVIHSESYYYKLMDEDVWPDLVTQLDWLLQYHKDVNLIIENVSPLRNIKNVEYVRLSNNCMFDNVEMVKKLREQLPADRVFTCLDTCHAMLANKYISALYREVGDVPMIDLSMERFFKENADTIGLIHLCDMQGSGYGKGKHGISFNKETYGKLCDILNLYRSTTILVQ